MTDIIELSRRRRAEEALRRRYGKPIEHRPSVLRRLRDDYPHLFGPEDRTPDRSTLREEGQR